MGIAIHVIVNPAAAPPLQSWLGRVVVFNSAMGIVVTAAMAVMDFRVSDLFHFGVVVLGFESHFSHWVAPISQVRATFPVHRPVRNRQVGPKLMRWRPDSMAVRSMMLWRIIMEVGGRPFRYDLERASQRAVRSTPM